MKTPVYKRDPHLRPLHAKLELATAGFVAARQSGAGLELARRRHDGAHDALAAYMADAAKLSERERQYAIEHDMAATALVRAKATLPPALYLSKLSSGAPLPSVTGPLPSAIRDDVDVLAAFSKCGEALGQALRERRFSPLLVDSLRRAALALAKARNEATEPVGALVAAVKTAVDAKNAPDARKALDELASHFGTSITAPPPSGMAPAAASTRRPAPPVLRRFGAAYGPAVPIVLTRSTNK